MRRMRGRGNSGHGGGHSGGNGGGNGGPGGGHSANGGQNRRPGGVPNRHQVFDSNGPEVRIRGNAWQVFEKYQTLARDSQSAGDRVRTESYLQHAEHYYRIILAINEASGETAPPRLRPASPDFGDMDSAPESLTVAAPVTIAAPMLDPGQMPQPSTDGMDLTIRSEGAVA